MFKRQPGSETSEPDATCLYLVTIVSFILALRFLSSPARARHGNWIGAVGMALAIVATFAQPGLDSYGSIAVAMAIGAASGGRRARA